MEKQLFSRERKKWGPVLPSTGYKKKNENHLLFRNAN